ncbi:MAG: hypothetical protein HKL91_09625 [Candidatus Eremiobacteraeota bacterium]|nr:hypothetical protein [Candidatus Eremiobacteraeota bacterium]
MTTNDLLQRLHGVRQSRDAWIARCPAHDDRSPSLSIKEGRDGRILVRCWAGCSLPEICSALGIRVSDLFASTEYQRPQPPRSARELEAAIANELAHVLEREEARYV